MVARAASRYLFGARASLPAIAAEHGCSPRSLGRWLGWIAGLASPAALQRRLVAALDAPLVVPMRDVAGLDRKATTPTRRRQLTRAAHVLVLLEALGSATGAEPPGLRGVLEARPPFPEFAARQAGRGFGTIPM